MNKDNAKDFLPLVQALADGKTIQYKGLISETWQDLGGDSIGFSATIDRYRIKPEPEEVWAWYSPNGTRVFIGALKGAEEWRKRNPDTGYTAKKFVEVM